ncbi:probable glucan 1,3-beta-glucosidase A [Macadamia integrifolia]|uniref:probable glucan 1,3-beta-glucosidase A n=1 Tax=Macadamia integrifolia TaxID=60698 RepID=UPI001C4F81BA|nr:probable glucan 1,3-beta-glucosidase A [Macadamia integrifolia]
MEIKHLSRQLLSLFLLSCIFSLSFAARANPGFKIKAVNLGGWLVTEGWIKPSLFDGIPNKDLLDGTQLQFKSVKFWTYLSAESGGGTIIVANRTSASGWETFKLWRINETTFQFRVFNKQFVGLDNQGNGINVVAVANISGTSETFEIVRNANDTSRVRIKASNGFFLQAKTEDLVTADSEGSVEWSDDDPSVFETTNVGGLQGEFQVTNGYGPDKAPQVMRDHWSTFIVEEDFKFISENGLNTVRIPVGWWIASDPNPPKPYVGGSLQTLDNAFSWAQDYSVKVIIDLHAAPGSQNGYEHSSSRDGSQDWGTTDENIQETVSVIDFLTARYAKNPSLIAVELINEPLSPGVTLDSLNKYYKAGYDAVRNHSSGAYVVLSNRIGSSVDPKELFPLASGFTGSVIDVHYYNLFSDIFSNMTVQQNVDFIYTNRSAQLNNITTSNGPLTFVGEWVAEMKVQGSSKEDYQKFGKAQLVVYGRATFGWAYWALKNVNNHWSLEWMIQNGYINP